MITIISYIGVASAWLAIILLIYLFFYFHKNKKNYYEIIESYLAKNHSFGAAYHFHSLIGYFGSFGIAYYFHCLKHKKKPLFSQLVNDLNYDFFNQANEKISSWVDVYYKITLLAFSCVLFSYITAFFKYIYLTYLLS